MEIKFVALLLLMFLMLDNSLENLAKPMKDRPSQTYPRGMKCVRAQCRQRCIEEGFEGGRCRKSRKTLNLGKKKCYCSEGLLGAGESGSESGFDGGGGVWDGPDGHASGGQGGRSGWARRGSHARRNSGRHGGIRGDGGIGRGGYGGGRHDFTEGGGLNRGVPGRGGFSGQGVDDGDENYGSSDGGAP